MTVVLPRSIEENVVVVDAVDSDISYEPENEEEVVED